MHARREDWHPADIIAALRKRGTSLAALSRQSGLSSSTLANALSRPWPKGEWLIATALKVHPSEICPAAILIRSHSVCSIVKNAFDRSRI